MLDPLGNGTIMYTMDMTADFELETIAIHRCNSGYFLVGHMNRTCMEGSEGNTVGVWDLSPPTCEPRCPPLGELDDGVISYSTTPIPYYDVGTIATHVCNNGFVLKGTLTRICMDSQLWSLEPPVCEPVECSILDPLGNGTISYATDTIANFSLGTDATYMCNQGFFLVLTVGSMVRTCQNPMNESTIGVWSERPPTCQQYECEPLPLIANGVITYMEDNIPNYEIGTEALYSCTIGYCLPMESLVLRVCNEMGMWTGSEPICQQITCGEFPSIDNGMVTYSNGTPNNRAVGTVVTFTCNDSFSLSGGASRTCEPVVNENGVAECVPGVWNNTNVVCTVPAVNDTATGDPLMTIPLYIKNTSAIVGPQENDVINLCFELHGTVDSFFNLVSDACVTVNAHYDQVLPLEPREDINVIDSVNIRAVGNDRVCRNIEVALIDEQCTISVDGFAIEDIFNSEGITVRKYRNRVRIVVPNCQDLDLVMWVFCLKNTFWSTFRMNEDGTELMFEAYMIRFVIARGFNLQERSHGLLGQFWNVPIQVEPYTGELRDGSSADGYYVVTVNHPNEVRTFTGWLYPITWEYREEYCLYAGNQQAGPVYEVVTPNDSIIEGEYTDYLVNSTYATDFTYSQFDDLRCEGL